MSEATGQVVGNDSNVEAFFMDPNYDPVLRKHLPPAATIGEVRKANPFGRGFVWVDFRVPRVSRLERVELLLLTPAQRRVQLLYHMNIDDINPLSDDDESWKRVVSTLEVVFWERSERIKIAIGTDSFAVNWGGPDAMHVRADGNVLYYLDGRLAYLRFERDYRYRKDLDSVTINELRGRASVLDDLMEEIVEEIRSCHSDMEFQQRKG